MERIKSLFLKIINFRKKPQVTNNHPSYLSNYIARNNLLSHNNFKIQEDEFRSRNDQEIPLVWICQGKTKNEER